MSKVTPPLVNSDGTAAVLSVTPTTGPSDRATEQLVRTLRDDTIPRATRNADMTASVGGTTAGYVDLADEISSKLVLTIAVVVALSFLLLMLAFRSVVIPLTAGLMNLDLDRRGVRRRERGVREGLGRGGGRARGRRWRSSASCR